jgi:hypothetical protein
MWTNFMLLGYNGALCMQRIIGDGWPCLLNLWSSWVGSIVLCNVFVWRCWVLFFKFKLTEQRIRNITKDPSQKTKVRFCYVFGVSSPHFI